MTENKRYVDNGLEAIEDQSFTDTETDKRYYVDYFDEIIDLLNEQDERIKELEEENEHLKYINNIYNDLGILPFASAKAVCDKLNEQDKRIKKLEEEKAELGHENGDKDMNNSTLSVEEFTKYSICR